MMDRSCLYTTVIRPHNAFLNDNSTSLGYEEKCFIPCTLYDGDLNRETRMPVIVRDTGESDRYICNNFVIFTQVGASLISVAINC